MRTLVFLLIALLAFTLTATLLFLLRVEFLRPDLLAVFVFFLARSRRALEAVMISAVLALLFAAFHRVSPSFFILQALLLLYMVRYSARLLNLVHPFFIAGFLFAAEIVLQLPPLALGALLFGHGQEIARPFVGHALAQAGTTALVAPWVYAFLFAIDSRFGQKRRDDVYLLRG